MLIEIAATGQWELVEILRAAETACPTSTPTAWLLVAGEEKSLPYYPLHDCRGSVGNTEIRVLIRNPDL